MRSLILAALLALGASASHAATVSAVGDTFGVSFNGIADVNGVPTVLPGLTATAQFTVTGWSSSSTTTTLSFDVALDNTSNASVWQSASITAIGFDTNPSATGGSSTGIFSSLSPNQSLPTGMGFTVEWCANNQPQGNCGGGQPPAALNVNGAGGTASVTLTFAGSLSSVDFSGFGIRWQALESKQLGFSGDSGIGVGTPTPPIPEPTSMAVFGLGALIVGAALRKRAKA
jgi:hypothetical protein